ncbi:spore protease YyaC [Cytobacillus kochii]|uniref:spore protease YyaC n=1 Tax=Cytobacillus kochii TaxID=859143 RepID=UPI003F7FF4A6
MNNYITLLKEIENTPQEKIIICVGTDRSTGDSLGPLVGTFLSEMHLDNFQVYGTIENPIHGVNLPSALKEINLKHPDAFIIGIDASLGKLSSIGQIRVKNSPLRPGAGVGKDLPEFGDCSIVGVVNVSGFMESAVLSCTRLSLVMNMAKDITKLIAKVDDCLTSVGTENKIAATVIG